MWNEEERWIEEIAKLIQRKRELWTQNRSENIKEPTNYATEAEPEFNNHPIVSKGN